MFAITPKTQAQEIELLTIMGSTWSYRTNTTLLPPTYDPADAWTAPGFDDSSWPTGTGLFGFDTGIAGYTPWTIGTHITNPRSDVGGTAGTAGTGPLSSYFRTHFTWNESTDGVIFHITNYVDDGILVFLNGQELYSYNVPTDRPLPWDTLTLPNGANPLGEGVPIITNVAPGNLLVAGDNVIAVVLHQQANTSSDDVFGMYLKAILPSAPLNLTPNDPTNRVLLQFRSTTLTVLASGSPAPTYQWYEDGNPILGGNGASLIITNPSTDEVTHEYYCHVENLLGSFDSRIVSVLYTSDTTPPSVVRVTGSADHLTAVVEFNEVIPDSVATDAFNWEVSGVGVSSSFLNPGGKSVTMVLASPMTPNTIYTASIGAFGAVTDLAGNELVGVDVEFSSWTSSACAGITFEVYDTSSTAGTAITLLKNHPNYPNNPSSTYKIEAFDTDLAFAGLPDNDPSREQYGGRLRALFIPPYSGNWRFFMNTDDAAELWFNPNGPSPSGSTLVAQETGCCNVYAEPGTARTSAPQALTGGNAYFIELIYKEAGGGDYGRIAARADGDPTPAASLPAIPGSMLGTPAAPTGAGGAVTISQQPANQTTTPNSSATFSVSTTSDSLLCYQWRRGGIDIPGANGRQYSLVAVPADNGAVFSVVVSSVGSAPVTSTDATLTVEDDTTRPTVVSVVANAAGDTLVVTYSEPMGAATATDPFNYTINGANPASATAASTTVVNLALSTPLQDCVQNSLVINGVRDLSANLINPNPTMVNFSKQLLIAMNATWRYNDAGTDLGTAWSQPGFDDSAWLAGPAPLGFEPETPQVPEVATPLAAATANNTAYFRIHFNLGSAPGSITSLRLTEVLDDGAVYYFNGVEAHRTRMAVGPVAFATLANASGPEPTPGTHTVEGPVTIATTGLVAGDNVLAVEVHPSSATSSDSIFAVQLSATLTGCVPPLTITRSGPNVIVTWSDASFTLQSAPAVTGPWGTQAGASGVSLNAASGNLFLRLIKQ